MICLDVIVSVGCVRSIVATVDGTHEDEFIIVIPNRTKKGLAYVLAQFLHAHRLQMQLEGEPRDL